jgi:hypothetical protein
MKKGVGLLLLTLCVLLSACTSDAATTAIPTIQMGDNQSLVIGQITAIFGNDVTLALATNSASQQTSTTSQSGQSRPSGQGRPSGTDRSGQTMPSRGQRPSGSNGSGETMPSNADTAGQAMLPADSQTTSSGNRNAQTTSAGDTQTKTSQAVTVTYTLTGETLSTRIPVGVKVTTLKGIATTFSRLAVGDMIKILMTTTDAGRSVPVAVWIVG